MAYYGIIKLAHHQSSFYTDDLIALFIPLPPSMHSFYFIVITITIVIVLVIPNIVKLSYYYCFESFYCHDC